MTPETVVCFRWTPAKGYRSTFGPESVNTLRSMVRRHFDRPHRFVCFTDDTTGLDPCVEALPLWSDFADLPSPHGGKNPSCYRRLRMFSAEIASVLGQRFVSLDLDCVLTADVTPLWDRPEDFVMWGDTNSQPGSHYNGSMILQTAGARRQVWDRFDPKTSPSKAKAAGCWGSDQGWISYCLGPKEARWSKTDGVYSFRNHLRRVTTGLPPNARAVFFHGEFDPWTRGLSNQFPWIAQHWRQDAEVAA